MWAIQFFQVQHPAADVRYHRGDGFRPAGASRVMNDWSEAERHVERAHELYEAGRWDDAERELREALALNPYRAEWHFNLGLTLEASGRFPEAVRAFRDAHNLEPDDVLTLMAIATNSLRADQPAEAIQWLDDAQSRAPDRSEPLVHRIEALARLGRHEEAEVAFYQVLQLEGDHAAAYANIAESLIDRRDFQRAIFCLREAASLDPGLPRVHARLAFAYAETARPERARQLFLRELRDNPGDTDTILDLGCLLVDMNRLAEAGEKFRRVLEIQSDHPEAHFLLADLAYRQHRTDDAITGFRAVLQLDPSHPEVRRRLAELLLRRDGAAEARRLLRQELRRLREKPADFNADDLADLARLLLDVRLPRDAERIYRLIVGLEPDDADAWHGLSVAQFLSGDRPAGVISARRAIRLDSSHVPALHNLALAMVHDREWKRARAYLKRALAIEPEDVLLRRLAMTLRLRSLLMLLAVFANPIKR